MISVILTLLMLCAMILPLPVAASDGSISITGVTSPIAYAARQAAIKVSENAAISNSGSFSNGSLVYTIASATSDETLSVPESLSPATGNGDVSIVAGAVFLGDGAQAVQVGSINSVNNGQNGKPLQIDFSTPLENGDFLSNVTGNVIPGWTVNLNQVTLGPLASKTQGHPVSKSGSGPYVITGQNNSYSFTTDRNYNTAGSQGYEGIEMPMAYPGTYNKQVMYDSTIGKKVLRMWFSGTVQDNGGTPYDSVFGPEAISAPFSAKAGDTIAFDWKAENGGDDYEVYGFIEKLDGNGHVTETTELMYGRGLRQSWTTSTGTLASDGTYQFRFVCGSYDNSGGHGLGASLYITSVRLFSGNINYEVVQKVAQMVTYHNDSNTPAPVRNITMAATNEVGLSGSVPITLNISTVTVPSAPTLLSATPGDGLVGITWSPVQDAAGYKVFMNGDSVAGAVYSVVDSVYQYVATNLTNGVPYTFAVKATNDGGDSAFSNQLSATPQVAAPGAPVLQLSASGDSYASIVWNSIIGATGYKVYVNGDAVANAVYTVTDSVYKYDATCLINDTLYTFAVKATNAGGDSAFSNEVTATPHRSSSGGGGASAPSTTPATGAVVFVNGTAQNTGTANTSTLGNRTITTISVDPQKMTQRLDAEGKNATVTITANAKSDAVIGELTGDIVKAMEQKQATLEIKADQASYRLPALQIKIDDVRAQIGQEVELKDLKIHVEIAKPTQEVAQVVEDAAKKGNFIVVAPPVEFSVTCTYNNKTVSVSKFNAYVERTIAIPQGVDPSKVTTGVVTEPDGTVRHVPTKLTVIDGKPYAVIRSVTNSAYSLISHPVAFRDVANHWAKDAVNDMGSRMIISGVGDNNFEPDRDITRAEFTTIIVNALGLKAGVGDNPFTDVNASDWYSDKIKTAVEYQLISGYGDGKFGPMDKVTREQAMTMIAKAMTVTGMKVELSAGEVEDMLKGYGDAGEIAAFAKNNIATCVKTGIVSGRSGNLVAPKDSISRAEVSAIVARLLKKSNLI